jgi:hypothetical protein
MVSAIAQKKYFDVGILVSLIEGEKMVNRARDMEQADVSWSEVWPEIIGLIVAFIIPIVFLVSDLEYGKPDFFVRGGTVALFIVAVLEFKNLLDLNRKHLNNDLRIKDGEKILDISRVRGNLGWLTLLVAIYGAAISAFGDKLVVALVKLLGCCAPNLYGGG